MTKKKDDLSLRNVLAEGLKAHALAEALKKAETDRQTAQAAKIAQAQRAQLFIAPDAGQAIADAVKNLKLRSFSVFKTKHFRFGKPQ
jgi:hypothetical protein